MIEKIWFIIRSFFRDRLFLVKQINRQWMQLGKMEDEIVELMTIANVRWDEEQERYRHVYTDADAEAQRAA